MNYIKLDELNISRYEISEESTIRNIKTKRIIKINLKGGFQIVNLRNDDNKSNNFFIHLVVAKIFVPNPDNYKYVVHIDNNKLNNKKSNIKWVKTRKFRNNTEKEYKNELWIEVVGLEDYEVSQNGFIRNKYSKKLLKGHLHGGYIRINIKNKKYFLHTLLAKTFLGNPKENETVDHIDRNKINNNINNLRWASKTIQTNNRFTKNQGIKRPIGQYTINGILIKEWNSLKEAAQFFNTYTANIKHNKKFMGFLWKYHDIYELENEEFKNISNCYINIYPELTRIQVSNMGRIKFNTGRITYGSLNLHGYKNIRLKERTHYVHRLIMYAFNPNSKNLDLIISKNIIVNHNDGNKSNNVLENLEWCSLKENVHHSLNVLNKIGKTIYQYSLDNIFINKFNSIKDASRMTNIHNSNISACLSGRNKSAGNYKWKYSNKANSKRLLKHNFKEDIDYK
jgi:hypothetical protein